MKRLDVDEHIEAQRERKAVLRQTEEQEPEPMEDQDNDDSERTE